MPMYFCPYCDHSVQDFAQTCPSCDEDLLAVARLNELPDVYFNEALRAARSGDWATAAIKLGGAIGLRFNETDAWMLLGLVCARQRALKAASECFRTVLALQRGHGRAQRALGIVERLMGQD